MELPNNSMSYMDFPWELKTLQEKWPSPMRLLPPSCPFGARLKCSGIMLSARCLWLHGIYYLGNIFKVFLNNSYSLSSNSKNKQTNQHLETVKWWTIASLWGKKNKFWNIFVSWKLFSVQQFINHHSRVQWHLMITLCLLYSWFFSPMIVGNKQTYFFTTFSMPIVHPYKDNLKCRAYLDKDRLNLQQLSYHLTLPCQKKRMGLTHITHLLEHSFGTLYFIKSLRAI